METVIDVFKDLGLALYFIAMTVWGLDRCYYSKKGDTPLYRKIRFASIMLLCSDFIIDMVYAVLVIIFRE